MNNTTRHNNKTREEKTSLRTKTTQDNTIQHNSGEARDKDEDEDQN
jgi:hypothetical protein